MIKLFLLLFMIFHTLHSANWPMLQGTESKVHHNAWGFAQVRGQNNSGDILIKNGINKTPFSYVKPTLEHQTELQLARLRLGLRGAFDDDNNINYFLLTELAPNGVNNPLDENTHNYLVDASLTFKYLPVYLRVGKFKYAGSEEGNMARFTSPFIMFSTVGDQLMLERFTKTSLDKPSQGVGAYRDSGAQLFQSFKLTDKESLTISYMLGNGSGVANENVNGGNHTHYGFLAYENILGKGKGYSQESLKVYSWYQEGKRKLYDSNSPELYERIRYGLGLTYYQHKLRVEAEYMKGKGMIYTGAKDTDNTFDTEDWKYSIKASKENEADGYYILSTYEVMKDLEILARYEKYNRMTNSDTDLRKFETITTGFSYKFKGYDRIDVNYAFNRIKAPYNAGANEVLQSVGNILSIQYTIVFK